MKEPSIKNIAASVRQRLLNKARKTNRPFSEVLQYFAMERFLYRLSLSPHADKFVLKGALMLTVWEAPLSRPTMDIDLLGRTDNSIDGIVDMIRSVCFLEEHAQDGIVFDADSVIGERITEDADYEGVRVRFQGSLDTARFSMQLDIGFGDTVVPQAGPIDFPTILELPGPRLLGYSMESTIAEKFEAMVKLGLLNSRMKDFYDILILSRQFDFDGHTLSEAVRTTFLTRGTAISATPTALTDDFATDASKGAQWKAFLQKNRFANMPEDFRETAGAIKTFLGPIAGSLSNNQKFSMIWKAPGSWRNRNKV